MPARVLLQDFTGVPCVVDLAAMRDALAAHGRRPGKANPLLPADLVIDHSVQVDQFGTKDAFDVNALLEFQRNRERYILCAGGRRRSRISAWCRPTRASCTRSISNIWRRWCFRRSDEAATAYPGYAGRHRFAHHHDQRPGRGRLGRRRHRSRGVHARPADLHAAAAGGRLQAARHSCREGCTATDLVLTVTQMLRKKGVVGKFVEFYGDGLSALSLADRATDRQHGARIRRDHGFFPVDDETLELSALHQPPPELVALVEAYTKEQGLFRDRRHADPVFSDDASNWISRPSCPRMAGPKRPQDRVNLPRREEEFQGSRSAMRRSEKSCSRVDGRHSARRSRDGAVVIAAITSCTNTSNPSVMVGAGLLAKKAVERGLKPKPWVKTSLAPGSKVVTDYLIAAGLMPYLEELGFHLVGYGCTTCIGNSGPLPEPVAQAVKKENLVVAAVLSGNRNFEGRINAQVKANYLASPPLVVAYALAGRVDIDLQNEPLGTDRDGAPVYLRDIWPTTGGDRSGRSALRVKPEMFASAVRERVRGRRAWKSHAASRPAQTYQLGREIHLHQEAALLRRYGGSGQRRSRICTACACSRCWAIPSPPTTSRRPATSRRIARPDAT